MTTNTKPRQPEMTVSENGTIEWKLDGKLHREDGPAHILPNGTRAWLVMGVQHREGAPAVEHDNGFQLWYRHGQLHREDGPAVRHSDGYEAWYLHGTELKGKQLKALRARIDARIAKEWTQTGHDVAAAFNKGLSEKPAAKVRRARFSKGAKPQP